MHELIVSPFLGNYIVVRQGRRNGVTIPRAKYMELVEAIPGDIMPTWLAAAARRAWYLDVSDEPMSRTILVRPESLFGYGRASTNSTLDATTTANTATSG
jgi:hypothetical protein